MESMWLSLMATEITRITVGSTSLLIVKILRKETGLGGEAVSKAIVFKDAAAFKTAGYQKVQVNASYVGGQVKQAGNLSFTRVYDAGNEGQCLENLGYRLYKSD
jgi:hypothetical protein